MSLFQLSNMPSTNDHLFIELNEMKELHPNAPSNAHILSVQGQ